MMQTNGKGHSSKKIQSISMKEVFVQNQFTTDILRSIVSRSEDIAILKSISDPKTSRLRLQTAFAEKSIQEIESKEEWRLQKEEASLSGLINAKLELSIHKKQFKNQIRKMLKANMQFNEEPSENEMNLSDINVQKVMNIKVGPDNTLIYYNHKGHQMVSVPSAAIAPEKWRETYSQEVKIVESFFIGEVLNVYPAVYFCVKHSRNNYSEELHKQRKALLDGASVFPQNISVVIVSKKIETAIVKEKQILSSTVKDSALFDPNFFQPLLNMMLEMNSKLDKAINKFKERYSIRNSEEVGRIGKNKALVEKALRIRNYEKYSAVVPWRSFQRIPLQSAKTIIRLKVMPQILFDLENPYFDETHSLAFRIRVIHSCIVLQKRFRSLTEIKLSQAVVCIQKHFRGYLARKQFLVLKTANFRSFYFKERLKRRLRLLIKKNREKKSKVSKIENYSGNLEKILRIQKFVRGFLAKTLIIVWKKEFFQLRQLRDYDRFYMEKQNLWKTSLHFENLAVYYTVTSGEKLDEGVNINRRWRDEVKHVSEIVKFKEKAELEVRTKFLSQAKDDRIKRLE